MTDESMPISDDAVPAAPARPLLDEVSVRILGSLIEKQFTTPDNYPLTLNALTAACNQSSNRDPVMQLDEEMVKRGLGELARHSLSRGVYRSDSRALRFRQEISLAFRLHEPELAALCVLMLRGPQTPGEIRTRTARMFEFVDPRHVEITLESLMTLPTPLVARLPRRRGQKEERYAHLLSGEPRQEDDDDAQSGSRASAASTMPAASSAGRSLRTEDRIEALEQEIGALRAEVAELRAQLEAFRRQFE